MEIPDPKASTRQVLMATLETAVTREEGLTEYLLLPTGGFAL